MAGKRQPYTRINNRRNRDALNCPVPLGKRFEIKPSLESISDGALRAAYHPHVFGPVHHFLPRSPWGGHPPHLSPCSLQPGSRGRPGEGGDVPSLLPHICRDPVTSGQAPRPATGLHLPAHLGGRGPSPRAHLAAAGGGPPPGREERRVGAAPPPAGAGRAGAARRGEAARWGSRPAAWPRSGCCCSWRWGTPGPTGRSHRTATGECPPPRRGTPWTCFCAFSPTASTTTFFFFLPLFLFNNPTPRLAGRFAPRTKSPPPGTLA